MDPVQLRNFIIQHFNDRELRDQCYKLDIDYDALPGAMRAAKVRELVNHCRRRPQAMESHDEFATRVS